MQSSLAYLQQSSNVIINLRIHETLRRNLCIIICNSVQGFGYPRNGTSVGVPILGEMHCTTHDLGSTL